MTKVHPTTRDYIPAAGRDWTLPFYDTMTRLAGAGAVHRRLVAGAELASGQRVLEIGCGTGNLSIEVIGAESGVELTAIDPDPLALERARRKSPTTDFRVGYAQELAFEDESFDRVFSALMLHHLDHASVKSALAELFRVCKPGGSVHVVDFVAVSGVFALMGHHHFPGVEQLSHQLTDAGFTTVEVETERRRLVGEFAYLRATRAVDPAESGSGGSC